MFVTGRKFLVVLPSPLVKSFFDPTIKRIGTRLRSLKHDKALCKLSYVFLVGGFSSSPLIKEVARTELHGHGCVVVSALRPEVAIVRGAVLFATESEAFNTRKARLTYGAKVATIYYRGDPEHVKRYAEHRAGYDADGMEMIFTFDRHITVADDIPQDGVCVAQTYLPGLRTQSEATVRILASHKKNINFPNKGDSFELGKVTVPLDMSVPYAERGVKVQFTFGGTQLSVACFRQNTGEKVGQTTLSIVQEVEEAL